METLKLKFKLHALEFEVEGQQEVAREEFRNFHDAILSSLLNKIDIQSIPLPNIGGRQIGPVNDSTFSKDEIPTLSEIKLRDLAKSESDWIIVYAAFASEFGIKEFSRDDLLNLLESTGRKSPNRVKSLSQYIKNAVSGLYIKPVNDDNQFILLEKGKNKAFEIFQGFSTAKTKKSNVSKKDRKKNEQTDIEENKPYIEHSKSKSAKSTNVQFIDLKFSISDINALSDFIDTKKPQSLKDEIITVLCWYIENKNNDGATIQEIQYLLKVAGKNVSSSFSQTLINMKGPQQNLISKDDSGKFSLTSVGLRYVVKNLPKSI